MPVCKGKARGTCVPIGTSVAMYPFRQPHSAGFGVICRQTVALVTDGPRETTVHADRPLSLDGGLLQTVIFYAVLAFQEQGYYDGQQTEYGKNRHGEGIIVELSVHPTYEHGYER